MPYDARKWAASLQASLTRAWALAPVTILAIAATVGLYAARLGSFSPSVFGRDVDGSLGAVVPRVQPVAANPLDPRSPRVIRPELYGPLDLWNGEWWRIPVSGFHHGGLVHLAVNVLSLWILGALLEPRMRRTSFLALLITGTTVSLLPEFLLEHYVVGISGGLCAMFGMLLAMRNRDPQLREVMTGPVVRTTIGLLVACVAVSALGLIPIANVAHFTGLLYGWVAGELFFGRLSGRVALKGAFLAAHVAIPVMLYAAVHPWWIGRYQWYRAYGDASAGRWDDYENRLKKAVASDHSLVEPWNMLAVYQAIRRHDLPEAWRTAVKGLRNHESNARGAEIAQSIFEKLSGPEQKSEAIRILNEAFGDDSPRWAERLTQPLAESGPPLRSFPWFVRPDRGREVESDQPEERQTVPPGRAPTTRPATDHRRPIKRFDPDAPDSAAEGEQT